MKPVKKKLTPGLQEKIERYFDEAQQSGGAHTDSSGFEQDDLYRRIQETLARKEPRVDHRPWLKYAALIAVFLTIASLFYFQRKPGVPALKYAMAEKKVSSGSVLKMQLTDGTLVWLNAGSKLQYPEAFGSDKREVTLEGEAYFEVKHENRRPFLIHTQNLITQVLGTSFNVRSYPGSKRIKVTVLSGKVAVYEAALKSGKIKPLIITANQEVIYLKQQKSLAYNTKAVIATETAAWKEGNLIFNAAELSEVILELERKYNISIKLDTRLLECRVTVNFNNEPLERVLKVLPRLIDGTLTYEKGKYKLSGPGCQ